MSLLKWLLKPDEECFRKTFYTIGTSMDIGIGIGTLHSTAVLWLNCCSKNPFSALFNYRKRCKFGQTFLFNNPNDTAYSCRWVKIWPLTVNKYFAHKDGSPV